MQTSKRLIALDILRGLTMAAMILVNNPGSWRYIYPPLEHAEWHGWTPTDLIFPFFVFMVGVSIKLSLDKYLLSNSRKQMIVRIIKRSILIYCIGAFLYLFPDFNFSTWRILGVLQRIAICYLFASLIYISLAKIQKDHVHVPVQPLAIIFVSLLVVYFLLMKLVPVPGYGAGLLAEPESTLACYLDKIILGVHNYGGTKTWDPEGILSTMTALATTISGMLCAVWLKSTDNKQKIFRGLLIAGAIAVILAYLIHPFFPINKKIWTSSFVLLTSGLACILLGLIYWYTEIKSWRFGTQPFLVFGSNAITAYFLSSFFATIMEMIRIHNTSLKGFIYHDLLQPIFGNTFGSLVFALLYVILWWAILSILYKRRIFIKI